MKLFLLLLSAASAASLPKDALRLPPVRQATEYSCGPASLLSVLEYWGVYDGTESGLYKELETTPKDGTEPESLAGAARRRGLSARLRENMSIKDLREAVTRGETVILDLQAWKDEKSTVSWENDWDDGHYVVLAAVDSDNAYVMDPSAASGFGWLPLRELERRWHDFEDRHGAVRRYVHAGVVIGGKKPAERAPERVE